MDYLDGYSFLGSGANNECFYKDTQVAKVFNQDFKYAEREAGYMMAANKVNSLAVNFISLESYNDVHYLFMEKIDSLSHEEIVALSVSDKQSMLDVFKSQLKELHQMSIYHIDIKTPSGHYNNVVISSTGIRLIDWGSAYQLQSYGQEIVYRKEWNNFNSFCEYFMDY
jgi:serine/threonine protein kinase